jgi:hypothetical protein
VCFQAEDGKTELSLVHFTLTNPEWQPPTEAEDFVAALRTQARRDANQLLGTTGVGAVNPLYSSLHSVSSLGAGVCLLPICSAEHAYFLFCPSLLPIFNQDSVMEKCIKV